MGAILRAIGVMCTTVGAIGTIAGLGATTGMGTVIGAILTLQGIVLFAIGTTLQIVAKLQRKLDDIDIWIKASR